MELSDFLGILDWRWRPVVIAAIVSVLVVGIYALTRPKVHSAGASGFVTTGSATSHAEASIDGAMPKSRLPSYVHAAKTRATAEPDIAVGRGQVDRQTRTAEDLKVIDLSVMARVPASRALSLSWVTAISALAGGTTGSGDLRGE